MWVKIRWKKMQGQEERNWNLLPHFCPAWRWAMLQRLGIVMATAGFSPASLAMGERKTAQIQVGIARSFLIWVQHAGGTLVWAFWAAPIHGVRLRATVLRGLFPQYSVLWAVCNMNEKFHSATISIRIKVCIDLTFSMITEKSLQLCFLIKLTLTKITRSNELKLYRRHPLFLYRRHPIFHKIFY